jgi:hypothetical protein
MLMFTSLKRRLITVDIGKLCVNWMGTLLSLERNSSGWTHSDKTDLTVTECLTATRPYQRRLRGFQSNRQGATRRQSATNS